MLTLFMVSTRGMTTLRKRGWIGMSSRSEPSAMIPTRGAGKEMNLPRPGIQDGSVEMLPLLRASWRWPIKGETCDAFVFVETRE